MKLYEKLIEEDFNKMIGCLDCVEEPTHKECRPKEFIKIVAELAYSEGRADYAKETVGLIKKHGNTPEIKQITQIK